MLRFQAILGGLPASLEGYRITPGGAASPHQSVAENVMLGLEPTWFGFIRRRELEQRAVEYLDIVGWTGDLRSPLGERDVVDWRRVQLARAIAMAELRGAPAVLIDDSVEELALDDNARWQVAVARAADRIPVVIAVSTLDDINPGVDGVLVNNNEQVTGPFEPVDAAAISAALEAVDSEHPDPEHLGPVRPAGDVLLEVRDLTVMHPVHPGRVVFEHISLEAHAGRVTGLAGTHAHELLASLSGRGFGEISAGTVTAAGVDIVGLSREKAIESGVVFTTEHPLSYEVGFIGGIPSRVSADRLRALARTGMVDAGREYRPVSSASLLQAVGVGRPPSRDQFEGMLDALITGPAHVVLLAEPLLGIGFDERAERIAVIDRIAAAGKAVVVAAGADDLAVLADEALLVAHGSIRAVIVAGDVTAARIVRGLVL